MWCTNNETLSEKLELLIQNFPKHQTKPKLHLWHLQMTKEWGNAWFLTNACHIGFQNSLLAVAVGWDKTGALIRLSVHQ
jgi:hypothetical protein